MIEYIESYLFLVLVLKIRNMKLYVVSSMICLDVCVLFYYSCSYRA